MFFVSKGNPFWFLFYIPFNIKLYRETGRMIMNGSVQWSTVQSWVEFCLQWDSNPGPHDPKSGMLTTRPPRCFLKYWKGVWSVQKSDASAYLTGDSDFEKLSLLLLWLFMLRSSAPTSDKEPLLRFICWFINILLCSRAAYKMIYEMNRARLFKASLA